MSLINKMNVGNTNYDIQDRLMPDAIGQAGQVLKVKDDASGLEFGTVASGGKLYKHSIYITANSTSYNIIVFSSIATAFTLSTLSAYVKTFTIGHFLCYIITGTYGFKLQALIAYTPFVSGIYLYKGDTYGSGLTKIGKITVLTSDTVMEF